MARKLPHARFVTIPDAGHLAPMERPKVIGAAIQDYLESVGDSGSLG
jgi:pimeloyl-ACP methyl ester carboxylesterase